MNKAEEIILVFVVYLIAIAVILWLLSVATRRRYERYDELIKKFKEEYDEEHDDAG